MGVRERKKREEEEARKEKKEITLDDQGEHGKGKSTRR
jgi:hypothetical protein